MRFNSFFKGLPFFFLLACSSKAPKVNLVQKPAAIPIERFDSSLFEMDTLHLVQALSDVKVNHPLFYNDYFTHILGIDPMKDSLFLKSFIRAYLPIYKAANVIHAPIAMQEQMSYAFGYFKIHFPKYVLPKKLIYFIGPIEGYGNVITSDGLAIGLQMFLGPNATWYHTERIQNIYPPFVSKRFSLEYMPVVSLQNLLSEVAPFNPVGKNLLTQMVEQGKRQYILEQCLPQTKDTLLWGYSSMQLHAAEEALPEIWSYIQLQKILYSVRSADIRDLMYPAAYNHYFGNDIPGDVGRFVGYKIVLSYMRANNYKITLPELLKVPAQQVLEASNFTGN